MNMSTSKNQCKTDNFENLRYVPPSKTEDFLLNKESDQDNNFFNANVHNFNISFIFPENLQNGSKKTLSTNFSIIY